MTTNGSRTARTRQGTRTRRELLGGFLAGSVGLPFLEGLRPSLALAADAPVKRFVVMFTANGTIESNWAPSGSESEFTLGPILKPLAAHQQDLVIVRGLQQMGDKGDGHQNGIGGMLTGAPLLPGKFAGQGVPPTGWSSGPSVDQRAAEVIGRDAAFRSVELGVQTGPADNFGRMCYRARNRPLPPLDEPKRVFESLFWAALADPATREQVRLRRASVLDFAKGQFSALSAELGAADRQRLDQHLTYLRDVEQRLGQAESEALACVLPDAPTAALGGNDDFPALGELQLDLLVLALACGRTRVASLQWSRSVSPTRFTWLGIQETHHELSHIPDSDVAAMDKLTRINAWYAERFAGLIERLKAYPEGDTTLFDNSLLLWCNELGKGNTHSRKHAPYVLAGSAGGALRTGRYLVYEGDRPHNDLLVSLLNVLGVPDESFGLAEWCSGPLPGFA
jgi:hypothetical protein